MYVAGLAQDSDINDPGSPCYAALRDPTCSVVTCNPGVEAHTFRAASRHGMNLFAFVSSVWVPMRSTGNPYWAGLQDAVGGRRLWRVNGAVPEFGSPSWPEGRIYPSEANADRLATFIMESGRLRAYDGIFLDEATREIQPHLHDGLGIRISLVRQTEAQLAHAHYMHRLIARLGSWIASNRESGDMPQILVANTSGWTHPSLDGIAVEMEGHGAGGSSPSKANESATLQNRISHGKSWGINPLSPDDLGIFLTEARWTR